MDKTMKAAVLHAPGDLRVEEVNIPELGSKDVLVKVAACGVCGSDVPRVLTKGTYHFPTIPGHEFSGEIVSAGADAAEMLGRQVAVIPLIPCGTCEPCSIGESAQCERYDFLGSRNDGGFSQFVRVPASNVVTLPEGVDPRFGAMMEPITVALHAVESLPVHYGDTVAVFGLGAIGNFIAQWARIFGARVFAIDVMPEKVEIAKRIGLTEALCSKSTDVQAYMAEATGGKGLDIAFDASGANPAIVEAIKALRKFGKLGLVGRVDGEMALDEASFEKVLRSQLVLQGIWSFEMKHFPHSAWQKSSDALGRGDIVVEPLITHEYPLENTFEAVKLLGSRDHSVHKILILPN